MRVIDDPAEHPEVSESGNGHPPMPQETHTNRRFVLAERPTGEPTDRTLRLESGGIPKPAAAQMLLRTEFLSLDPYMRGRMSDEPSYAPPVEIGAVMVGGTVSEVVESQLDGFSAGDRVLSYNGWQDYALSDGKGVTHLANDMEHPSWALGVLGMPGLTAWAGLKQIGQPKPGETLVVAAATGPVGATVGQIGKILGCRVVGVAGGPEKCDHAVKVLGFDACIDHKHDDFASNLVAATPDGIDVYFENVGGKVFDAVIGQLNTASRVPVCGLISQYNATGLPAGPDRMGWLMGQILRKRITMRGFIVFDDFAHLYPEFAREMGTWVETGRVQYREEIIDGLENAPAAFIGLLRGEAFGKRVIRLGSTHHHP
jgi:NADPH-dependent curcumin reductase